jgi:hypothetical protein
MKVITKPILIFIISLVATACATTQVTLPEKYVTLENELEEVQEIYKFNARSWEKVDNQSLILRTGPSDYYLIVLHRPARSLVFSEAIRITDTVDKIKPGYDHVIVEDSAGRDTYIIQKIYRLEDRKQSEKIKKQLIGKLGD